MRPVWHLLVIFLALPALTFAGRGEAHYDRAYSLLYSGSGKYGEIASELEKAAILDPSDPDIFCMLGETYDGLDDYSRSISNYSTAIILAKASPLCELYQEKAYSGRGYARFLSGEFKAAAEDMKKSLDISSQNHNLYLTVGDCYSWMNDFRSAVRYYNRSIEADAEFPPSKYESRALAYYFLKDYAKAMADLEHSISLYPHSIMPYLYSGVIAFARDGKLPGDFTDRIEAMMKSDMTGRWDSAAAGFLLGKIELKTLLSLSKDYDPGRAETYLMAGYLALWRGDPEQAAVYFQECRKDVHPYQEACRLAAFELERLRKK